MAYTYFDERSNFNNDDEEKKKLSEMIDKNYPPIPSNEVVNRGIGSTQLDKIGDFVGGVADKVNNFKLSDLRNDSTVNQTGLNDSNTENLVGDTLAESVNNPSGLETKNSLSYNIGKGLRNMVPAVATAGAYVNDAVNLVPNAFGYTKRQLESGFKGEINREEFRPFESKNNLLPNISNSAVDRSKFTEAPQKYIPNPKNAYPPQPIVGNPEQSIRNTQAWLAEHPNNPMPGQTVQTGTVVTGSNLNDPGSLIPADEWPKLLDLSRDGNYNNATVPKRVTPLKNITSPPVGETPFVQEVMNGNNVKRVAMGGTQGINNIETPFINGIQNARPSVADVKTLLGDLPHLQAQASYESAQALEIPKASTRAERLAKIAQRKDDLTTEYLDPNTSADRRGQIGNVLGIKDDTYDKIDLYDELGNKTGQQIYNKNTGKMAKQAMTPADIINSNPVYKKAFNEATPEKKDEILKNLKTRLLSQQQ